MTKHTRTFFILLLTALLLPVDSWAHTGAGSTHGFLHGFEHPLFGLDHVLAMVAVGLLAALQGGRSMWLVPLSFMGVMTLGGLVGMMGLAVPMVEFGIVGSVVVLGAVVAWNPKMPAWASMLIVALFAFFHGHAHGTEMPHEASGALYALGFILATGLLHASGIGATLLTRKVMNDTLARTAGGAIALAGLVLMVG